MSDTYQKPIAPPRIFVKDDCMWKYYQGKMEVHHQFEDWIPSIFTDPRDLEDTIGPVTEVDSDGDKIVDRYDGPEWDEDAMMQAGKL